MTLQDGSERYPVFSRILSLVACLAIAGCIHGNVVDVNDYPIRDLELSLADLDTGAEYRTTTGDGGAFEFEGVPNGSYRLTAERYGYEPFALDVEYTGMNLSLELAMENRSRVEYRTFEPPALAPMKAICPGIALRQFAVYYPPSYDREPERLYPIIYWLHGNGQNPETFFRDVWFGVNLQSVMDEMIAFDLVEETVLVVPDGELPESWIDSVFRGSFFVNSAFNGDFEDYLAVDLVDCVEENADDCLGDGSGGLRVISDGRSRGIVGMCMGVTGALNVALKYTGQYAAVGGNFGIPSFNELIYPFTGNVTPFLQRYIEEDPWVTDFLDERSDAFFASLDGDHFPENEFPLQPDGSLTMVEDLDNPGELVELWTTYYLDTDPYTYLVNHPEAVDALSFYLDIGDSDQMQLEENNMAFSALLEELGLPSSTSLGPDARHHFEIFHANGHVDPFQTKPQIMKAIQFVSNHLDGR